MPASKKADSARRLRTSPDGCYTLHGSLTSPYEAGFLTPESPRPLPFSYYPFLLCAAAGPPGSFGSLRRKKAYIQWDTERLLLCYSDRIVQDSHLIPSSDRRIKRPSLHMFYMELYCPDYSIRAVSCQSQFCAPRLSMMVITSPRILFSVVR